MQLKCSFCAMPFSLNKEEIAKMVELFKGNPDAHYDAHCPKCRKATKISKKQFALNPVYKKMLESNSSVEIRHPIAKSQNRTIAK